MSAVITSLLQTCWASPSQWEGELADGRAVYIRYRWGTLRATAGRTIDDAVRFGSAPLSAHLDSVTMPEDEREQMTQEGLAGWVSERTATLRAAVPDGELLVQATVGDALDGVLSTEDMLAQLAQAGVTSALPGN